MAFSLSLYIYIQQLCREQSPLYPDETTQSTGKLQNKKWKRPSGRRSTAMTFPRAFYLASLLDGTCAEDTSLALSFVVGMKWKRLALSRSMKLHCPRLAKICQAPCLHSWPCQNECLFDNGHEISCNCSLGNCKPTVVHASSSNLGLWAFVPEGWWLPSWGLTLWSSGRAESWRS